MTTDCPSPTTHANCPHCAGLILTRLLPFCTGGAVLHAQDAPVVAVRVASLAAAQHLAAALGLTWHSQATGRGVGALAVHAWEGLHGSYPVTVYAIGDPDTGGDVAVLSPDTGLSMLLGGLYL